MATNNATNTSNPVTVAQGGSGATTFVAYTPVTGGTTSTAAFQSVAALGSAGNVLTSNGASALPTFQAAPAGSAGIALGTISNNWYAAGTIFGSVGAANNTISVSTGTLYYVPIFISKSSTYIKIGLLIGATSSGTTVMGLYNDSGNGKPTGSPIANSNSTSVSNSANSFISFTFGSPITLAAGTYWCAFSTSATNDIVATSWGSGYCAGGRGLGFSGTLIAGSSSDPQWGWSQTFSYSATLPSVGTLAAQSPTLGFTDTPYIFLQAQ